MTRRNSRNRRNIESVKIGLQKLSNRDLDGYFDGYSPDFKLYSSAAQEQIVGVAAAKMSLEEFMETFPDLQIEIEKVVASDEVVAASFIARGTQTKGFFGLPVTNKPFQFSGLTINKFGNGKRLSTWQYWDNYYILEQVFPEISGVVRHFVENGLPEALANAVPGPEEELIFGRAIEDVQVREEGSKVYMPSKGKLYHLNGELIGTYSGAFEPTSDIDFSSLAGRPSPPEGPIDQPGEIEEVPFLGNFKLELRFNNRDSISVVGSARAHLCKLPNDSGLFMASVIGSISGGTGAYQGASGLEWNSGSALFPVGVTLTPGTFFRLVQIYVFQIRKDRQGLPKCPTTPLTREAEAELRKSEKANDKTVRRNISAMVEINRAFNRRRPEGAYAYYSPEIRSFSDTLPGGRTVGKDATVTGSRKFGETFPEQCTEIIQIFGEQDFVVAQYRVTGTETKGFGGLRDTSAPFQLNMVTLNEFRDGLRHRVWAYWDRTSLLRQIGLFPLSLTEDLEVSNRIKTQQATTIPGEELVIAYGKEVAEIHQDGRNIFINASGRLYGMNNELTGNYSGMIQPNGPLSIRELRAAPRMPAPPIDGPEQISGISDLGRLKVRFDYGEKGSVTVVGSGTARLVPLPFNAAIFMISAGGLISEGTGDYQGVTGIECESGAAFLPGGTRFTLGTKMNFRTISVSRFVHPPGLPSATAEPGESIGRLAFSRSTKPRFVAYGSFTPSSLTSQPTALHSGPSTLTEGGADGSEPGKAGVLRLSEMEEVLGNSANFLFFSQPNATVRNIPLTKGGEVIGVEVHEILHRFEIEESLGDDTLSVKNLVGQPVAQVQMTWRPIPDDFVVRHGAVAPPTPLDPTRSQRFTMESGRFALGDQQKSGFEGFGSGRTFPVRVEGQSQLRIAAVVNILKTSGAFAGLSGLLIVNGYINPPNGLALSILLRLVDPVGALRAKTQPAPLASSGYSDPGNIYLMFKGEPLPGRPLKINKSHDGRIVGATGPQRLRLVSASYDVKGQSVETSTREGAIIGEVDAKAWFSPENGNPPYTFQTTDGVFRFFTSDGMELGSFDADIHEGWAFPSRVLGSELPIFRVGGIAPVTRGSGIFEKMTGILTVNSLISLAPNTVSGFFVLHISAPARVFRARMKQAWGFIS